MSEWKKVKIGDNRIGFKYFPLSFINEPNEKRRQIINTVVFKYIESKYQNIQELSTLIIGTQYGYNASALQKGRNKFLRISDIKDGAVNWETVPFCDCKDEETYRLFENDILIARTGGTTGKSFLITSTPENAIYAGYLIRIRVKKDINPHFVYAFLNSYAYWPQISELKAGSAQPNVNAEKLKQLLVPVCPIEVQNEIVRFLKTGETVDLELTSLLKDIDKLFRFTDEQSKLFTFQKSHLTLLRQQILQDAISGKLTGDWRAENPDVEPAKKLLEQIKAEKEKLIAEKKIKKEKSLPKITEDEVPFELPEGWEWCRLGEITTYGTSKKIEPKDILDDTWILDLEDIEKESSRIINYEIYKNKKSNSTKSVFKKGDILYSKLRPYLDKVVVAPKDGVCTTEILPLPVFGGMNSSFFMYSMKRRDFLRYADQKVKGMKMPRLGTEDGKRALFPLPSLSEQKAIVAKVEKLMESVSQLEERVLKNKKQAEELVQVFLAEVFGG